MNRTLWTGAALVVAAVLLGFQTGSLAGIDKALLKALAMTHARSPEWSIWFTQEVTLLGDPSVRSMMAIGVLGALIYRHCWRSALVFLMTVALSIFGHSVLKEAFSRPRPELVPWLDQVDTYAYPSGHAAGSMVVLLLGSLLIGDRRLVWAAVLLSFAIGLSRVVLGVHWPSDVIGGWMFGGGTALIGYAAAQRIAPKEQRA